jgi:hypothetical protein
VKSLATSGRANDVGALVRLADQAFGKPTQADDEWPGDEGLATLTREERATLRAILEGASPEEELREAHPAKGESSEGAQPAPG